MQGHLDAEKRTKIYNVREIRTHKKKLKKKMAGNCKKAESFCELFELQRRGISCKISIKYLRGSS